MSLPLSAVKQLKLRYESLDKRAQTLFWGLITMSQGWKELNRHIDDSEELLKSVSSDGQMKVTTGWTSKEKS